MLYYACQASEAKLQRGSLRAKRALERAAASGCSEEGISLCVGFHFIPVLRGSGDLSGIDAPH